MPDVTLTITTIDKNSDATKNVTRNLNEMRNETQALVPGLENARQGLTSFVSQNAALIAVLSGVALAFKKTIDHTIEYANSVRDLSTISGTSTEEASRFIQVLDDYNISASDALAATRALTNEGHVPSIETLAKLSDEYLSITDAQKKNEFVIKNLGRGGLQWVEVLNKGSKAIREQGAAVNKNLILSEKAVKQAREYELALDDLGDTWEGLSTTVGTMAVPIISDAIKILNADLTALLTIGDALKGGNLEEWAVNIVGSNMPQFMKDLGFGVKGFSDANADAANTSRDAAGALEDEAASAEALKEAAKEARDELQRISEANSSMLDNIQTVADYNEEYAQKYAELVEEQKKLADEAEETAQKYGMSSDEYKKVTEDINANREAVSNLQVEYLKWQNQMIFDILLEKLKSGIEGLSDSEFELALHIGETLGIFDEASVRQAEAMNDIANAWAASAELTEDELQLVQESVADTKDALEDLDGTTADVNVVTHKYDVYENAGSTPTGGTEHAAGGSFVIPAGYENEGWYLGGGNTASSGEMVTVTPSGGNTTMKGGATIIINNPVPETASESMMALKKLSYLDVDI